jgi:hypothetical protein
MDAMGICVSRERCQSITDSAIRLGKPSSSFAIGAEDGGHCLGLGGLTWQASDDFSIGDLFRWEHLLACMLAASANFRVGHKIG